MAIAELTLSDFLRKSGPALEQLEQQDLLLRRRDGEDVYLKRADREQAEHESLALTGHILAQLLEMPRAHEVMVSVVDQVLPWTRFLPEHDRVNMVEEMISMIEASAGIHDFAPVGVLLKQWKNSAEAWANSAFMESLEADPEGGGQVVERPAGSG